MCWHGDTIHSWKHFVDWVDDALGAGAFLYRGQPKDYGTLEPTFLRLLNGVGAGPRPHDRVRADKAEKALLDGFVREAPLHLNEAPMLRLILGPPEENILIWWGIMQHYGAPTRVLDWTGSPYVAAYFAVEKEFRSPCEVLCYNQSKLEAVWAPAFTEGCLAGYPRRLDDYRGDGRRVYGKPILHHFIHQIQTARMAAQQGVFTVCTDVYQDHAQLLQDLLGKEGQGRAYRRAVIPAELKIDFLKQLRLMNIMGVSLFPGIDGVGRRTAEAAHIDLLGEK